MRKVIMYCDRCKKEFEKWNHKQEENIGVGEIVHDDGNPYLDCQKDLCESCYTELVNWWNYKPKSEWQHDHEILKAYSNGANDMLDKIKAEMANHLQTMDICNVEKANGVIVQSELTNRKVVLYDTVLQILDKYKEESEAEDEGSN